MVLLGFGSIPIPPNPGRTRIRRRYSSYVNQSAGIAVVASKGNSGGFGTEASSQGPILLNGAEIKFGSSPLVKKAALSLPARTIMERIRESLFNLVVIVLFGLLIVLTLYFGYYYFRGVFQEQSGALKLRAPYATFSPGEWYRSS
jgi:hypothetical protein